MGALTPQGRELGLLLPSVNSAQAAWTSHFPFPCWRIGNLPLEGDPSSADYLLDEAPESRPYMAHTAKPTIPVFVVAAHPQAGQGAGRGQTSA
jgi:hypothetical protein